jgi:hypothetical protein
MRNDLTIYDKVADRCWSDDIRWVRTLKNLVPGRLAWFDGQIDWQSKAVLDSWPRRWHNEVPTSPASTLPPPPLMPPAPMRMPVV